jgi:hypothetical protein
VELVASAAIVAALGDVSPADVGHAPTVLVVVVTGLLI